MRIRTSARKVTSSVLAAALGASLISVAPLFADETAEKGATTSTPASTPEVVIRKSNLRESQYYYNAFNRRDPFRSLVDGNFARNQKMNLVNMNAVELVGILKGELERFALLEDDKGYSYILRVGDKVRNGTVVSIGDQQMVARVTTFGQTSTVRLHLIERQQGVKR